MRAEIIKLGSMYLDGRPAKPGVSYNNGELSFGNTVADCELQWVQDGNLLVADRCICSGISWEQLDQMGFVFGTPVWIDGDSYLCRCLKVGKKEEAPNEWDALLDKFGKDDSLWHWWKIYFWGQETSGCDAKYRAVRGWSSACYWSYHYAASRFVDVSFRPALEPLIPELSELLIGSNIKVFGADKKAITGQLVEFDNYDLVLSSELRKPKNCCWATWKGKQIVIDRKALIGIGKA